MNINIQWYSLVRRTTESWYCVKPLNKRENNLYKHTKIYIVSYTMIEIGEYQYHNSNRKSDIF
jgi:hypothetical protein